MEEEKEREKKQGNNAMHKEMGSGKEGRVKEVRLIRKIVERVEEGSRHSRKNGEK